MPLPFFLRTLNYGVNVIEEAIMSVNRYPRNVVGRSFAVGDIHGHPKTLMGLLKKVDFNPATDFVYSPGDFFDRGPGCMEMMEIIFQPWFRGSLGNHEMALIHVAYRLPDWERFARSKGRQWFMALPETAQRAIADALVTLPYAMEVQTEDGPVGFIHAASFSDWDETKKCLKNPPPLALGVLLGERARAEEDDRRLIKNLRALIVGHVSHNEPTWRGNTLYLDTGCGSWSSKNQSRMLTIVELESLSTFHSRPTKKDTV